MNTIDITNSKEGPRVLENACQPGVNPKGTRIVYAVSDFGAEIAANNKTAAKARELFERGLVHIFQKRISKEPVKYLYIAEVR